MQKWAEDLENEWYWLPKLAPPLSLRVPGPVGKGQPSSSYPCPWAIYGWIEGKPYADELVDDEGQAAKDLAQFVVELRRMDGVVGAPPAGRKPLRELDVDDRTWNRARGFALHQAAMIIPYYGATNPGFVALAKRTIEEVLADING